MKLAIIADIHGDVHALQDTLRHIDQMQCERILCAGDLVDWGHSHEETIRLLRGRRVLCIFGNHDRWAIGHGHAGEKEIAWSHAEPVDALHLDLARGSRRWLANLPGRLRMTFEGVRVSLYHGIPRSELDGVYPDTVTLELATRYLDHAFADVLIVGQTHIPFALEVPGRGWIVNPGALLRSPAQPIAEPMVIGTEGARVNLAPGLFGVLELPSCEFKVYSATDGLPAEFTRRTLAAPAVAPSTAPADSAPPELTREQRVAKAMREVMADHAETFRRLASM